MAHQEEIDRIVVTVSDDRLPEIQEVASALQAAGMTVENILSVVGIITGSVPRTARASLRSVAGVVAVETEGEARAI